MKKLSMHAVWGPLGLCSLAGALLLFTPSPSLACKCAPPPPVIEALQQASAVFEGQVTQLTPSGTELEVTLRVTRAWKGVTTETLRLRTRADGAACGVAFAVERSYLVYANQSTATDTAIPLEALRCGRTRLAAEADEDFTELGLGVVPVAPRDPTPTPPATGASGEKTPGQPPSLAPAAGGCAGCSTQNARHTGWPGVLLLAVAGLLFRRRSLNP